MDAIIDEPITTADILALRTEAGDTETAKLCTRALLHPSERQRAALRKCRRIIEARRLHQEDPQ